MDREAGLVLGRTPVRCWPPVMAEQTYCDWCSGPLTAAALAQSRAVGLDREESRACERCLAERRFEEPPGGWDDTRPWPFHPWPFETEGRDGAK